MVFSLVGGLAGRPWGRWRRFPFYIPNSFQLLPVRGEQTLGDVRLPG